MPRESLLERLAVLTPRPRVNVVPYHGILAPRAAWRAAVVAYGRAGDVGVSSTNAEAPPAAECPEPLATVATAGLQESPGVAAGGANFVGPVGAGGARASDALDEADRRPAGAVGERERPGRMPPATRWAELLQRVFAVDVLVCPRCSGRMRVIATIHDPAVIRRILAHLELPVQEAPLRPPPSWYDG